MTIPLSYNLRNLVVRKTTTIMTALGIALTVAVLLAILSLMNGLRSTLAVSGDPLQVLVLRKGSVSEVVSNFERTQFQDLKFKPGIATGSDGQPLASLEVVTVINLANVDNPNGMNVTVRGLQRAGIEMRRGVHLVKGRWHQEGHREIVVGKTVEQRFPDANIGQKLHFAGGDWDIVGVIDAGHGAQNSELWGDLNQIAADLNRMPVLSSALVRATDAVSAQALVNNINNDQRLNMTAMSEQEYYAQQTQGAAPIEFTGLFVAIVMAIGSAFAAMNTMYAAVARRAREIGTLRVLGFSRGSILVSFFLESVLLSGLGGLIGCLIAWLLLNGRTTGIGSSNFAELAFDFRVTPETIAIGIAFAVVLGAVGGFFPARMASKKEILTALREV
jgi:putative ABC transport system permease protein